MAPATKRKKGAVVGTVYSDSDEDIEIDLSATVNIQKGSSQVSHKRFVSETLHRAPTLPGPIPSPPVTIPNPLASGEAHHGPSTTPIHIEKAKRKQVCFPCLNNLTAV